jgi:starch phosphorylase
MPPKTVKRSAPRKRLAFKPELFENLEQGMDARSIQRSFASNLLFSLAKDQYTATRHDKFWSLAVTIRDRLMERWIRTQQTYHEASCKRVYYLSLEFLIGRLLGNAVLNLGLEKEVAQAMNELGLSLEDLREAEEDAGLGNGGLGRLAACFLDSMATLRIPCHGYGIRYEYGIFNQSVINGFQVESPDTWLRLGNPWEIERPEFAFTVKFYGRVEQYRDSEGEARYRWVDTKDVLAMPYDTPIPGYRNNTVNNLRLWSAKSTNEFDFDYFNHGDYVKAIEDKAYDENISKVLYPNDNNYSGKELRIKQQYFFVSASLQDILRRFKLHSRDFRKIPDEIAIQLNDTHPAVAIPEFMRLLMDEEGLCWDDAWDITVKTFAYTNHTLMPEALEKWPVSLYSMLLPRHLQIIFDINHHFLKQVSMRYPGNVQKLRDMSIIEEGPEKQIRMAYLSIIGSHSTNGVARLHTELLKNTLVRDFNEMFPERFNSKTNGITPRRWLKKCNPELSRLISNRIGENWVKDLYRLKKLAPLARDQKFVRKWRDIKMKNKIQLAAIIERETGYPVDPESLFDVQVKRIHEYKRQLLLALFAIHRYNLIKEHPKKNWLPRTIIFGGKAAPGYFMAKLIIKLINNVSDMVNNDPDINGRLKVIFLPNYRVSLAEKIIPATDLSEQISLAGTEASGTGNMKFCLNGALIIGTMDGANIEIAEEVGEKNMFIFGLRSDEVDRLKREGYDPREYIEKNAELKKVLHLIECGFFSPERPDLFAPIVHAIRQSDPFMLSVDFSMYLEAQQKAEQAYRDKDAWTRKCIACVAKMGRFSSDRTIQDYAREIWSANPVPVRKTRKKRS